MTEERFDLVVIGAGPAGCCVARSVARSGQRVLLVEAADRPGGRSACGGAMPLGLAEELGLVAAGGVDARSFSLRLVLDGKERVHTAERAIACQLRREVLDGHLASLAVEAGAELRLATLAREVDPGRGRVLLRPRAGGAASGRSYAVRTRLVAFADGPATLAQRAFGIGFDLRRGPAALATYAELASDAEPGAEMLLGFDTRRLGRGYFWCFPKLGHLNFGVGAIGARGPDLRRLLKTLLAERGLGGLRVIRVRGGAVPVAIASRLVARGAMVVGDAAGLASGLTGAGLEYAIRSGELAGEVAARALAEEEVPGASLSRYARRWSLTRPGLGLRAQNSLARRLGAYPALWPRLMAGVTWPLLARWIGRARTEAPCC